MDTAVVIYDFKTLRKSKKLSQCGLAISVGSSPSLIVNIERYKYVPGPEVQEKLAKALNVERQELWPADDDA